MRAEEVEARLPEALARVLGASPVAVTNVRQMTGGAVHETWAVDVTTQDVGRPAGAQRLVLRVFVATAPGGMSAEHEFSVLRAAFDAGVPAPRPVALLGSADMGAPSFLMERVDGETIGRRLVKDALYAAVRPRVADQLGRIAAAIHGVPLSAELRAFLSAPPEGASGAEWELRRIEGIYRDVTRDPHPAFELALRWLRERLVPSGPHTLVHGDYRVGNVVYGPEGVRAVLDWEGAHIGDPMEDLGWVCVRSWRFGGGLPVGGVGKREELFAAYEAAGGAPVDPRRVRWWEVFGNLRWGIITLGLAAPFLRGHTHDVEPAAIGRRAVETEWELLELMEAG